ncbi:MAG: hypothetical protein MUO72_14910 [Bacteroidales bacterium]|nr:hypothetical protein [Bacteroidales bacterium]
MKNLIIHPGDQTTDFLIPMYANLKNKTVVKGGITKLELRELIVSYDRVLMLGHGSPYGLLNPDQFPDAGSYIIDNSMVLPLMNKSNSIYIWCFASKFVHQHELSGLCTGMFISEVREANSYCFDNIDENLIDQSNERFSWIVSKYLSQPIEILYQKLLYEYELLARTNPIARFNLERLYIRSRNIEKYRRVIHCFSNYRK